MSDSESDIDEANLPPAAECDARCEQFAAVTGTDAALAMFYLQNVEWDLKRALNSYYETSGEAASSSGVQKSNTSSGSGSKPGATPSEVEDSEPHRIRILSWNIDGLDSCNIKTRTTGVCDVIKKERPDIVYLQEVVPNTIGILEEGCPAYQFIPGNSKGYFTAVMLKVGSTSYKDHSVHQFYSSTMGRNLLTVQAKVKGVPMELYTSHLESTKDHAAERKKQLTKALDSMKAAPSDSCVVFAGDLNLRDKELAEIGGLPAGIVDMWEATGQRKECKFTWDTTRNDNLEWSFKFKPRCRFDRMYLRQSTSKPSIKPVYFELVGIEKLKGCGRFPSDHWGILGHFDII